MPKKAIYDREAVLNAALDIIRWGGMEALTVRSLASKLGCSVAPVFELFKNMDEIKSAAIEKIKEIYSSFVVEGLKNPIPFKGVGTAYIRFAVEEPNFFKLLFMCDNGNFNMNNVLSGVDENYVTIFNSIVKSYGLTYEDSQRLYLHMWIYTHGIAVLFVTGTCSFTPDEIEKMISEACQSLIKAMRERG